MVVRADLGMFRKRAPRRVGTPAYSPTFALPSLLAIKADEGSRSLHVNRIARSKPSRTRSTTRRVCTISGRTRGYARENPASAGRPRTRRHPPARSRAGARRPRSTSGRGPTSRRGARPRAARPGWRAPARFGQGPASRHAPHERHAEVLLESPMARPTVDFGTPRRVAAAVSEPNSATYTRTASSSIARAGAFA